MIIGWALGLLSVLIASFSQILLKKAAQKQQNNFIKNPTITYRGIFYYCKTEDLSLIHI